MDSVVLNYVAQVHFQQQNHGAKDLRLSFISAQSKRFSIELDIVCECLQSSFVLKIFAFAIQIQNLTHAHLAKLHTII